MIHATFKFQASRYELSETVGSIVTIQIVKIPIVKMLKCGVQCNKKKDLQYSNVFLNKPRLATACLFALKEKLCKVREVRS